MTDVHHVLIQTRLPRDNDDLGQTEEGWFIVQEDVDRKGRRVVLTDSDGVPPMRDRLQAGYQKTLAAGDDPKIIASMLLQQKVRASRSGNNFNRHLARVAPRLA